MIAARDSVGGAETKLAVTWGGLLLVVVAARFFMADEPTRRHGLQVVLALMATSEALGGVIGIFRARAMAEYTGRPYDAAYHGVRQDFGFYNVAIALLLALCAVDPKRNAAALLAVVVLYALHGGTHILRYLGLYYGGETPIPTRPVHLELRDGLQLLVALTAMLLFLPV
jgi:hypothetical protein